MIATIVHVYVKPEHVKDFISATEDNHLHSIKEEGSLRFDVLQDALDPTKFVLYEAYATAEAVTKHKEMAHYLRWRDTVAPWMEKPREGIKHALLFPAAQTL